MPKYRVNFKYSMFGEMDLNLVDGDLKSLEDQAEKLLLDIYPDNDLEIYTVQEI